MLEGEDNLSPLLARVYESMDGSELAMDYSARHDVESAAILTVFDDERADQIAGYLAPRIGGRIIVEIGGGIGLLAFHLGLYAKRVYCIEANPMWSWVFAGSLLAQKPKNVSYLFGSASEFYGLIHADVALFVTHSDAAGMREVGSHFAKTVIDVYNEIMPHEGAVRNMKRSGFVNVVELVPAELDKPQE